MSKLRTLTPIHVGSGSTYYVAYTTNNMIYTLDDITNLLDFSDPKNERILNELQKGKNMSRGDFISKFNIDINRLTKINKTSLSKYNCESSILGYVNECLKENGITYIPGSSIKGYVNHVLFYDIITSNSQIRRYFENEFEKIYNNNYYNYKNAFETQDYKLAQKILNDVKKKSSAVWNIIENNIKDVFKFYGFRDVYFTNEVSLYELSRYGISDKNLPIGNFETIPMNTMSNCSLMFNVSMLSNTEMKIREIKKNLSQNNTLINDISLLFFDEAFNRIKGFDKWFEQANRKFMSQILNYEYEFIVKTNNSKVDIEYSKEILLDIIEQNKNKVIIQIGRGTNYILKTISLAFGQKYYDLFELIFSPSVSAIKHNKKKPGITMSSLVNINDYGVYPLGFIEVEL